jgi:hypothetical protein
MQMPDTDVEIVARLKQAAVKAQEIGPLHMDAKARAANPWFRPDPQPSLLIHTQRGGAVVDMIHRSTELASCVRMLPALNMDLCPAGAPIGAWLIQGFYPLVRSFHRVGKVSTIKDTWTAAFRAAAMAEGPINTSRGVFERLNEEEERLAHAAEVQWNWWQFCDALYSDNTGVDRSILPSSCVIVLPILNVRHNSPLGCRFDALSHPRVVWLVVER